MYFQNMRRYLYIVSILFFTLIVATACHDESEEQLDVQQSIIELVKKGKKKPKMVYSTGEKKVATTSVDEPEEQIEKSEKLEITMDVIGADLQFRVEGYLESGYLFIQDKSMKVIFTQNVEIIDKLHPLEIHIPDAEDYPYYIQIESVNYIAHINVWLE